MIMTKIVDGVAVPLSEAEAQALQAEWAAHDAQAPARIWEAIKATRDRLKDLGGYTVTVGGVPKWFHSDASSRIQQLGLVMLGGSIPPGLQWKTMDGSFVAMSQALAGQVFAAAVTQDAALFTHAETLRAQVLAAPDPAAVDITTGWPATFEG